MQQNENNYRLGRVMYILEAAFEYLISILVAGSFLATITKYLGISDSLTGILSSVISLGCVFQLLSVFIQRKRLKPLIVTFSVLNQLLFLLLYIIPLLNINGKVKIILFVAAIISAYLLYYFVHPKKINWLMSLVSDSHRGAFTANKEIVSLIAGMAFSYLMGAVVDGFADSGKTETAFIISALVILLLTVLHTLSMLFAVEKPLPKTNKKSLKNTAKEVFGNKNILKVAVVFVLYNIATYCSTPFYATYQIGELGFSLKFVTALGIVSSISRISVSKLWGRYADKKSFANMFEKCLLVLAAAYICVVFAVPQNAKIMFALYYVFHGIALGGINSGLTNLIFDYVKPENRADSLAVCQAASGVVGFVSTLLVSPLVAFIQNNGNRIFGINVYAQQFVTVIGLVFVAAGVVYVRKVIMKNK